VTARRVPYTVIGGYLGAGKTTLLNRLLHNADGMRIAVVVNDFGDVNIDADLVASNDGDTIALANGCVCCSIVDGFTTVLAQLRDRGDAIDHVVIEASGVSDPVKIGHYAAPFGFALSGVIVVADAEQVRERAADRYVGETVVRHLTGADVVVLNKTDLVDAPEVDAVRAWLEELAPEARVLEAVHGDVPLPVLLGAFEPATAPLDGGRHDHESYESWSFVEPDPLRRDDVEAFVAALPVTVVRAKGIVHLADDPDRRYVLQVVGRRWELRAFGDWGSELPSTRLVAIGFPGGIDPSELEPLLKAATG
jgi:G3E family GTPase